MDGRVAIAVTTVVFSGCAVTPLVGRVNQVLHATLENTESLCSFPTDDSNDRCHPVVAGAEWFQTTWSQVNFPSVDQGMTDSNLSRLVAATFLGLKVGNNQSSFVPDPHRACRTEADKLALQGKIDFQRYSATPTRSTIASLYTRSLVQSASVEFEVALKGLEIPDQVKASIASRFKSEFERTLKSTSEAKAEIVTVYAAISSGDWASFEELRACLSQAQDEGLDDGKIVTGVVGFYVRKGDSQSSLVTSSDFQLAANLAAEVAVTYKRIVVDAASKAAGRWAEAQANKYDVQLNTAPAFYPVWSRLAPIPPKLANSDKPVVRSNDSAPLGTVSAFFLAPDKIKEMAPVWVEANGQTVENPASPLFGKTLPNLSGRVVRGANGEQLDVTESSNLGKLEGGVDVSRGYGVNTKRDTICGGDRLAWDTAVDETQCGHLDVTVTNPYRKLVYLVRVL
jgi:hypothetical protein